MKRTFFFWYGLILGSCLLTGCSDEAALRRWAREWEALPRSTYPASAEGVIPPAEDVRLESRRYQELAATFNRIRPAKLEDKSRQRWEHYAADLKQVLKTRDQLLHDPAVFHLGQQLIPLLEQQNELPGDHLQRLGICLENAPAYYHTAKLLLEQPDPERTLVAIEQDLETLRQLREALPKLLENAQPDDATRQQLTQQAYQARLALKDYLAFCQSLYFEHSDTTLVRNLMHR